MSLLMMTQHTDLVRESLLHASGGVTLLLNSTPTSAVDLENEIRVALAPGEAIDQVRHDAISTKKLELLNVDNPKKDLTKKAPKGKEEVKEKAHLVKS